MARTRPDSELTWITEIVRAGSRRASLYLWMEARHDELADLFAQRRPNWAAIADGFTKRGITGPDSKPLNKDTCRHTWWRVRRDVARARARRRSPAPPVRVTAKAPAPPAAIQDTTPSAQDAGSDPLAKLRAELHQRSGRT